MSITFTTLSLWSIYWKSNGDYTVGATSVALQESAQVCGLLRLAVSLVPHRLDDIHPLAFLCVFMDGPSMPKVLPTMVNMAYPQSFGVGFKGIALQRIEWRNP